MPPPLLESDSDDDDYVPPIESDANSSDDEPEVKRTRISSPRPTEEDEEAKKQSRDALWASFQASASTPLLQKSEVSPKNLIKIEKRYKFAGEDILEVIEVPDDSPEAKKWPLWRPPEQDPQSTPPGNATETTRPVASVLTSPASTSEMGTVPKPTGKRPGPRKPKTPLTSLPTPSSQRAKKLTTLDKSAMDWRAHVSAEQSSEIKDELEANRRGGGYLEKVDFLKRVDERKEDAIEASKNGKRRRV